MKRFLIVLVAVCTISIDASHAQEMKKGMSLFNVGLGFVPGIGVNASYDYGLVDKWGPGIFTIGGYVGYENWGKSYAGYDFRANAFAFAPRATYRYAINKEFEVYGAAMLGAVVYSYTKDYNGSTGNVFFATVAGCRYSFARNISVFAEVGYNEISYLNGGLSFSF